MQKNPMAWDTTKLTQKNAYFRRFGVNKEPRHSEIISDKKRHLYRSTRHFL